MARRIGMTINYDTTVDALDIRLLTGVDVARTVQLDEGTLVDVDASDRVIAIEVIATSRRWPLGEILDRFEVSEADAVMLRALFGGPGPYPFSEQHQVAAAASAPVLVG